MPNRFNAKPTTTYGVEPLPTGYQQSGATSDFVIPSCGIEDVDIAMFNLFDKDIPLSIGDNTNADVKKVPVIFAGGEKWAQLKNNRSLRDKNGTLILPLLVVGRAGIVQEASADIAGRGINQRTGEIVIRRRLDKSDRGYQNLINKTLLNGQRGTAVAIEDASVGQLSTIRSIGDDGEEQTLESNRTNNIYETLVIPSPQFYTATYEVIIWTQYTHHMNQIIETIMSSFLPQVQGWRIDTPKGYWFIASCADGLYNAENNFDDMGQTERMVRYKFSIKVPAYLIGSNAPGVPVPIKKYVSCPEISFDVGSSSTADISHNTIQDPFLGADDPTLPLADSKVRNKDQRRNGRTTLYVPGEVTIDPNDPALQSLPRGRPISEYRKITTRDSKGRTKVRYVRVSSTNSKTGETSFSGTNDLGGLSIVLID